MRDLCRIGDPAKRVLGNGAGHRHRPLDQPLQRLGRAVGRRYDRLLTADEHPEAEIVPFRAFELLGLAEPPRMRQRGAFEQHRIGGIGTGPARPRDQILQQVECGTCIRVSCLVGHV